MVRIRRVGATLALAGVLCAGLALTPTPLSAASTTLTPQVTETVCGYLADAIRALESKPATRFGDFLLGALRAAQERYCS